VYGEVASSKRLAQRFCLRWNHQRSLPLLTRLGWRTGAVKTRAARLCAIRTKVTLPVIAMVTSDCVRVLDKESRQNGRYKRELDAVTHHIPATPSRQGTRNSTRVEPVSPLGRICAPTMHRKRALGAHPCFYRTLAGGDKAAKPLCGRQKLSGRVLAYSRDDL